MTCRFWSLLCTLSLCLLAPMAAKAVLTTYSDEADYTSAAGPQQFFIDFDGGPGVEVDGSTFNSSITFSSPEAADPTKVLWVGDEIRDAGSTTAPDGVGPVAGVFHIDSFGFGLVFGNAGFLQTIDLYDASDALIGSVQPASASGFFGVLSETAIARFVITPGDYPHVGNDRFAIVEFRSNRAGSGNDPVVPEPMTLCLVGAGSVLIGLRARKYERAE